MLEFVYDCDGLRCYVVIYAAGKILFNQKTILVIPLLGHQQPLVPAVLCQIRLNPDNNGQPCIFSVFIVVRETLDFYIIY